MNERRKIQADKNWWWDKNPNFSRLQMAVTRGAVVFGKDHVKVIAKFKQHKEEENGTPSDL